MKRIRWSFFFFSSGIIVLLPACFYGLAHWWRWTLEPQRWADYGTFLSGTSGVLVSAFGFAALLWTLRLQIETRQVSDAAYARDKLESHVFQLINRLDAILSDTDIRARDSRAVIHTGRDAFRFYYRKLRRIYRELARSAPGVNLSDRELARASFNELYNRNGSDFGHYFRTLYRCIKMIDSSTMDWATKCDLVAIVMAGLSKFEILLLFYNCLSSKGEEKFFGLVERYGLLEHCERRALIKLSHKSLFDRSAYNE